MAKASDNTKLYKCCLNYMNLPLLIVMSLTNTHCYYKCHSLKFKNVRNLKNIFMYIACNSPGLHLKMILIYMMLLSLGFSTCSSELAFDFYAGSCPLVETMVKDTVRSASLNDLTVPGKLLRLLFHDCFVEGCDGSVLVQGNDTERSDPANASLGGFEVIEAAKNVVEMFCPDTVSCADILVLAARDSVEFVS